MKGTDCGQVMLEIADALRGAYGRNVQAMALQAADDARAIKAALWVRDHNEAIEAHEETEARANAAILRRAAFYVVSS